MISSKNRRRELAWLTFLFLSLVTGHSDAQEPSVAFVNVNVIRTDREGVLEKQTVVTRGDRIIQAGAASAERVPQDATRIDGAGKYLLPGLAEMHGHIPPPSAPAEYVESILFLYVANGITTVRGMLGAPNQLELREKARAGQIVSPTLYLAGPSFNGNSIDSPEQAERLVREQKAAGWDLLKVHPGLTRAEYDAMATTARQVGIRFGGHVPAEVGLLHALEMGQETIDHLDGYIEYLNGDKAPLSQAQLVDVTARTRKAGAWVVPTMALWETLLGTADLETLQSYPELKYMPRSQVDGWGNAHRQRLNNPQFKPAQAKQVVENRMLLLKAFSDGGVRILLGTDAPQQFSVPGFSIHREIKRMLQAGMTPFEIIRSGTRAVGEYFSKQDSFGQVKAGQRADLILVDGNPLKDIGQLARPRGVMRRGKWLSGEVIQARLGEIEVKMRKP